MKLRVGSLFRRNGDALKAVKEANNTVKSNLKVRVIVIVAYRINKNRIGCKRSQQSIMSR